MQLPFFSVIVPTYARPGRLEACLRALSCLEYPRDRLEVIVVDDGSPESVEPVTTSFRHKLDLHLVRQPNAGPAASRNTGAARAKGTYLAFTDDDCAPDPRWLRTLGERLLAEPALLVGGQTINALPDNTFSTASQLLVSFLYDYYNVTQQPSRFLTSNNMALPADGFHRIGGFDSSFPMAAGEDRDFCDRWLQKGFPMAYVPDALIYHTHNMNFRSFWRQHVGYGRGACRFHRLRRQRGKRRIMPEPLSFYVDLMRFPFLEPPRRRRWTIATLLVLSQVANVFGFLRETFGQHTVDERSHTS